MPPLDAKGAADIKEELDDIKSGLQDKEATKAQKDGFAYQLRRLEKKINRLAGPAEDRTASIKDPDVRSLHQEVETLRRTVSDLVLAKDPELNELSPHFDEIAEDYPEIAAIQDPQRRIRAIKAIGRDYADPGAGKSARDGGTDSSRAYREGGGSPVMTGRDSGDESILEKKLSECKTSAQRAAVIDQWNATHQPE